MFHEKCNLVIKIKDPYLACYGRINAINLTIITTPPLGRVVTTYNILFSTLCGSLVVTTTAMSKVIA